MTIHEAVIEALVDRIESGVAFGAHGSKLYLKSSELADADPFDSEKQMQIQSFDVAAKRAIHEALDEDKLWQREYHQLLDRLEVVVSDWYEENGGEP